MQFFEHVSPAVLARLAILIFFAILFLQSGYDKVRDRKGNLEWMVPHFGNSPFKGVVPLLLTIVTVVELAAGVANAYASLTVLIQMISAFGPAGDSAGSMLGYTNLALCLVSLALLQLFAGQRVAKDYAGAASLAGYFAVNVLGFVVTFLSVPR